MLGGIGKQTDSLSEATEAAGKATPMRLGTTARWAADTGRLRSGAFLSSECLNRMF